jgi:HEAT repeat protein
MPPDPRLVAALVQVLESKSPALSVVAAWAIGKMGAKEAVPPLRAALHSRYRSVQGYSARALATLGDESIAPELLSRLAREGDDGLRTAYASALGKLGVAEAMPGLLARLQSCDDEAMAAELALAVARIVGNERGYIQLARALRQQPGTSVAQSLATTRRQLARTHHVDEKVLADLLTLEDLFAREQLDDGARRLGGWLVNFPLRSDATQAAEVLRQAACVLREQGYARPEYLLLALHMLAEGEPV